MENWREETCEIVFSRVGEWVAWWRGRKGPLEVGSQFTETSFILAVCFPPTTSDCPGSAVSTEGWGSWIHPGCECKHASRMFSFAPIFISLLGHCKSLWWVPFWWESILNMTARWSFKENSPKGITLPLCNLRWCPVAYRTNIRLLAWHTERLQPPRLTLTVPPHLPSTSKPSAPATHGFPNHGYLCAHCALCPLPCPLPPLLPWTPRSHVPA